MPKQILMMDVQAILTIILISSFILNRINCQTCTYVFRNIAPNQERHYGNDAYEKGEYSHVIYCAKFCAKDSICAGFILFREPQRTKVGKIACVFVNTYSTATTGKDFSKNEYADYYQREPSARMINSAQFYAADSTLVVNTDSHALLYKITDINSEKGITANLESNLPLSTMYDGWNGPPQASFTIPDGTFLVNGQKHQCFNKVSSTRYEMCTEKRTYSFFKDVFQTTEGKPLDAVVSFPDVLYVFSGNLVFYVKKTSTEKEPNVVYTAQEKYEVNDASDSNKWSNIPTGYTAITMVDEKTALVFTGSKYHLYDTISKSVLKEGYLGGQTNEHQSCKIDSQSEKVTHSEAPAEKSTNTETLSEKSTNTETLAEKPTNTETLAEKPTNTETLAEKPTNTETLAEKPTNTETLAEKPTNTETLAEKPTNTETLAEKPA